MGKGEYFGVPWVLGQMRLGRLEPGSPVLALVSLTAQTWENLWLQAMSFPKCPVKAWTVCFRPLPTLHLLLRKENKGSLFKGRTLLLAKLLLGQKFLAVFAFPPANSGFRQKP